jgi:MFS family permease
MLYGLTWTAYAIGGATGPLTMGHLYDRAGAYLPQFIVYMGGVALAAAVLSIFLRGEKAESPLPSEAVAATAAPSIEN